VLSTPASRTPAMAMRCSKTGSERS
jgi:hypothetical protein